MKDTKRILIIDDDKDYIELLSTILEAEKFETLSANSGAEGFNMAKSQKPDLIILDVMMETQDAGFETARKIKSDSILKKTPVFMLTNINKEFNLNISDDAGSEFMPAEKFFNKPIKPKEFISEIRKALK